MTSKNSQGPGGKGTSSGALGRSRWNLILEQGAKSSKMTRWTSIAAVSTSTSSNTDRPQQLTAAPELGLIRVCIFLSEKGCDPVDSYSRVPQPRCLWHWGRADSSLCVAVTYIVGYWAAPLAFTQQTPHCESWTCPQTLADVLGCPITRSCKPPGQSLAHETHFWTLLMVLQRGTNPFTNVIHNKGLNASMILT